MEEIKKEKITRRKLIEKIANETGIKEKIVEMVISRLEEIVKKECLEKDKEVELKIGKFYKSTIRVHRWLTWTDFLRFKPYKEGRRSRAIFQLLI